MNEILNHLMHSMNDYLAKFFSWLFSLQIVTLFGFAIDAVPYLVALVTSVLVLMAARVRLQKETIERDKARIELEEMQQRQIDEAHG